MKVLFNNLKIINYNHAIDNNNNRLHYSNTPKTDTFERRNNFATEVSFLGKNPFSLDEQNKINIARRNGRQDRERLLDIKERYGLNIDTALEFIDFDNVLIDKLEALSGLNKDLTLEDRIAILAYEIINGNEAENKNIIKSYLNKKKSGLEAYEAALATKLNLDENQIKIYLSKKGSHIEYDNKTKIYIPTEEEWMYLIKEDFSQNQLEQFAKLRDEKINLKEKTVRKQGGEQYLPFDFIIGCIKKGYSDEEIKASKRLIEFAEYNFPINIQALILTLSEDECSRLKERLEDVKNIRLALDYAKLTDEQYENYKKLVSQNIDKRLAKDIVQLTENQYKKYQMFLKKGVDEHIAIDLAQLTDEQCKKYKKFVNKGVEDYLALDLAQLTDEQYEKYQTLTSKGEDEFVAIHLSKLTNEQYNKFQRYKSEDDENSHVIELALLTDEQYDRYQKILNNGINRHVAQELAQLTEEQCVRYQKLLNNGVNIYLIQNLAQLTDEQCDRYQKLIDNGVYESFALKLASLTSEQYNRCQKFLSGEEDMTFVLNFAQLTDEQCQKYQMFINKGMNKLIARELAKLTEEQCARYQKLLEAGEDEFVAVKYAQLTSEQYKRYKIILNDGEDKFFARKLAKLTNEQYKKYTKLLSKGTDKYIARDLVQLTDEEGIRYKKLLTKGVDRFIARDIAKLTDKQCDRYCTLLKKGIYKPIAQDLAKLTEEQYDRYQKILDAGEYKYFAYERAQLTNEQYARYQKLIANGEDKYFALELAQLTDEQYEKFKQIPIRLSRSQAIVLAETTNLSSVTFEVIENLPDDFWLQVSMGCDKENYEVISKAMQLALLFQKTKDATQALRIIDDETIKKAIGDNDLKVLKENYDVNISKMNVLEKTCLLIEDTDKSKQYIAYNGILANVQELQKVDSKQFESWCNLSAKKQAPILAKAAEAFVFNLFDENENCIIGQNSLDFKPKEKTDEETEKFYGKKILELNKNNKLTAQNILKLIPKDCMLTISPYINDDNLLTAIVAEWYSKEGNRWQLEIHSQDLNFNDSDKWVFRLHKQIPNPNNSSEIVRNYFQFNDNNEGYDFNGEYLAEDSHIKIINPLENDNLLKEGRFQKIVKSLSSFFNDNDEIIGILAVLGLTNTNNLNENIKNIVDKLRKTPKELIRFRSQYNKYAKRIGRMLL